MAQCELDVQRRQRATTCSEAIEQTIDRAFQEEHETLDVLLVIVEHDVLVGRFRWRHRHEWIPPLTRRELIQTMRFTTKAFKDAAAGQPHHLTKCRDAKPCERIAQLRI